MANGRGVFVAAVSLLAFSRAGLAAPPEAVATRDFSGTLRMTGAIVEGTVTQIRYTYSKADGPRTHVTLSDVRAHVGQAPGTVVLNVFGGPNPDGTESAIADEPRMIQGKRYLAFLTNRPWRFSPLARGLAFRIEPVAGKSVLIADDGRPALSVGRNGIQLGKTALFERVDAPSADGKGPARLASATAESAAGIPTTTELVAQLQRSFPELSGPRAAVQLEPLPMDFFSRR